MFQLHPIDSLDQIELEMMVENLQRSAEKQDNGASKLTLIAAAAAVGGAAYLLSPAGRKKMRSARAKLAAWISPEDPMPMWTEEQDKPAAKPGKKEPKKAPTISVVEAES